MYLESQIVQQKLNQNQKKRWKIEATKQIVIIDSMATVAACSFNEQDPWNYFAKTCLFPVHVEFNLK